MKSTLIANYVGQGWTALMNIAFIPAYIHFLGIESYGLIGVFAVVLTAATLLDGGMAATINREMALYRSGEYSAQQVRDLILSVELLCLGIFAVGALAGLPLATLLAHGWVTGKTLTPETIRFALYLMIVTASLRVLEGVFRGALLGLHHPILMNGVSVVFVTLRAAGVILPLAFWSPTIETYFQWQAGVSLLAIATFVLVLHAKLPHATARWQIDWKALYQLRSFAGGVLGAAALGVILSQIDKILLVRLLPLDQFAPYALASAVAAGLYQLTNPVAQSFYPRFTVLYQQEDAAALARTYHLAAQTVALATAPIGAMLIVMGEPVLRLWTGNTALSMTAAPLLRFLALGVMFHCVMYIPYMLQLAIGWPRLAMRTNFIAVIVFAPTLLVLVPRFGPIAAAAAWAGLTICLVLFTIPIMHRRILVAEQLRWSIRDVAAPWAAAALTVMIFSLLPILNATSAVQLLYLAVVGIAAFTSVIAVLPDVRALAVGAKRHLAA